MLKHSSALEALVETGNWSYKDEMRWKYEMSVMRTPALPQILACAMIGLALSGCATAYGDQNGENNPPMKNLAVLSGLATSVSEAKDFVKDSRPEKLDYIPVGIQPGNVEGGKKPLTTEELLLLKKKLEAAQKQNSTATPAE